jgi:threonine/homoserine/homoserine lactone efflux protein
MSIDFLVTSLIVIVSPGTGVLYTLAAGLSRGSRASVVAAFGCTLGIVPLSRLSCTPARWRSRRSNGSGLRT